MIDEPVWDDRAGAYESPYAPADIVLIPGAIEGMRELSDAGFLLCVATNQPAAAKGTATVAQLEAVDEAIRSALAAEGVAADGWRRCLHHPDGVVAELSGACDCRKPAPGMLIELATELEVDLAASWMVGDSDSDVLAGLAAGCRTLLVEHPRSAHRRSEAVRPDARSPDLLNAAAIIRQSAPLP